MAPPPPLTALGQAGARAGTLGTTAAVHCPWRHEGAHSHGCPFHCWALRPCCASWPHSHRWPASPQPVPLLFCSPPQNFFHRDGSYPPKKSQFSPPRSRTLWKSHKLAATSSCCNFPHSIDRRQHQQREKNHRRNSFGCYHSARRFLKPSSTYQSDQQWSWPCCGRCRLAAPQPRRRALRGCLAREPSRRGPVGWFQQQVLQAPAVGEPVCPSSVAARSPGAREARRSCASASCHVWRPASLTLLLGRAMTHAPRKKGILLSPDVRAIYVTVMVRNLELNQTLFEIPDSRWSYTGCLAACIRPGLAKR